MSDIVKCQECGHMQLEMMPSDADLAEGYAEAESDAYVEEEEGQRATARWMLDRIEQQTARGALLDLGCWVGFLLDEAKKRGWETLGVEPSEFASGYARDQLGLEVRTAELFSADLPEGHFRAIVMADVIEHLPDPGAALERIARLLAPEGIVALALPDAGSRMARVLGRRWWSVLPTHVQYFTRGSLTRLFERNSYRLLSMQTAPKTFSVSYYLERLGGYQQGAANTLVRGAAAVGLADRLWTPDFRDRMLAIGQPKR